MPTLKVTSIKPGRSSAALHHPPQREVLKEDDTVYRLLYKM